MLEIQEILSGTKIMRLFVVIHVALVILSSCSSIPRDFDDLNQEERNRLDNALARRNDCLRYEVNNIDDGFSLPSEIARLVVWKCSGHDAGIDRMMREDFHLKIGPAWKFLNDLQLEAPKIAAEAVLARRKMLKSSDHESDVLRRN